MCVFFSERSRVSQCFQGNMSTGELAGRDDRLEKCLNCGATRDK